MAIRKSIQRRILPVLIALALVLVAATVSIARPTFRSGSPAVAAETAALLQPVPRPIFLSAGECEGLDSVVWPLNPLISPNGTVGGSSNTDRTEYSFTANVPVTIASMLTGSYAINVHASADSADQVITCGNVGGVPDGVGTLVVGLRNQGGLDVTGIAVLSPSPSDPAMTFISVFITGSALGNEVGTIGVDEPVATNPNPVDDAPPVGDQPDDDDDAVDDEPEDQDDPEDDNSGPGGDESDDQSDDEADEPAADDSADQEDSADN